MGLILLLVLNINHLYCESLGKYICHFNYFTKGYVDDMYEPDPMYAQVRKPKVKRVSFLRVIIAKY